MTGSTTHPSLTNLRSDLRGRRVMVFGLARSGVASCDLLVARGAHVTATDAKHESELPEASHLRARGVTLELGGHQAESATTCDLLVLSPGVPDSVPAVRAARDAGVPVVSEVELGSWFIEGRVLGITGSNGKTTSTALAGHVLSACDLDVRVGGNIGRPLTTLLAGATARTLFVLELSSFQLDTTDSLRCDAACLLNVTPDHLDRYGAMAAYVESKARVFRNQRPTDAAILNAEDAYCQEMLPGLPARPFLFSSKRELEAGAWLSHEEAGDVVVVAPDGVPVLAIKSADIPLLGRHNRENVMAVLLSAWHLGADMTRVADAVRTFAPVAHRLERVTEIDGVTWVNDSKATNLDAVMTALAAIDGTIVILLGGRDKGADWSTLPGPLAGRTRLALLLGEAAPTVERALAARVPCARADSMTDAVRQARAAARPGDTVLLSPGCASFDMFRSYEQRGDVFREEVLACRAS